MELEVVYGGGDRLTALVRGHKVQMDQPLDAGGLDTAPTPVELFVASLAACVGYYAERYLRRHGLLADGLRVRAGFALSDRRPARVGRISLRVLLPAPLPEQRRKAFQAVVEHCTVHNSIVDAPEITIEPVTGKPPLAA